MSAVRRVAVAVVSWNGRRHLETLLPALAAQDDPGVPWEVLLFDNGSKDGTVDWVRREHPAVRVVESPVNVGFCAANNRLVEAAGDADAVALLNNDTRPRAGWLAALVAALAGAPADVAAVSGLIVDWPGERLDFGRGVMTFDGHAFQLGFRRPLAGPGAAGLSADVPADGAELPFACGGNLLVRRTSFRAAGGFDEDYFAYLEDVDLGWRLWAGGERVLFARDAVVHHRSSATSDLLGLYHRGFLFERNALLTAFKNYDDELWPKMMPAVLLTFAHRAQHLLVHQNPGGGALAIDPYAGLIADTAAGGGGAAAPVVAAPPGAEPPARLADLPERWRRYGTAELARRLAARLGREIAARRPRLAAAPAVPETPVLTDERTVAQLRAASWLFAHLDAAADRRRRVQARRRRPDAEYFARFPPYLVPTYPGDAELFAGPGFRSLLPEELELVERRLEEVIEVG
ncbi:MAG TPA: glycosyltransferase family 2 protein [Thermoanaerobaculia bacterium]